MTEDTATRLRALMEQERAALRAGDLGRLESLFEEKQDLAEALAREPLDVGPPEIAALKTMAETNAKLLEAAKRGIQAAMARTADRVRVAGHLDTYDASGQRQSFAASSQVPRRA